MSPARACPIWSASVESSTTRETPSVLVITSGAREEPPIPQSTKRSTPLAANSSRRARMPATKAWESVAEFTQPRRIEDSASASLPQRVKSFAAIRLATLSLTKSATCAVTASRALPAADTTKGNYFAAFSALATDSTSSPHEMMNFSTPSRSSRSVTSS